MSATPGNAGIDSGTLDAPQVDAQKVDAPKVDAPKVTPLKVDEKVAIPFRVENLDPGKRLLWCTCGQSATQPFCDARSHRGTGMLPKPFTFPAVQTVALCGCKQTCNPPFCDGTHVRVASAAAAPQS